MASIDSDEDDSSSSHLGNPPPPRKQKVTGALEETLDRLPDAILVQILSLLQTKDAFATRILSKRWRYLWTFVYNFAFTPRDYRKKGKSLSFVEYVFAHSATSKLNKLKLNCNYYTPESQISQCLSFAAEKQVENVIMRSLECESNSTLPESFCTCSSLITLDITYNYFGFEGVIAWKSLKSIKLQYMELGDEHIVSLLSGCPALETMELNCVNGFRLLEIKCIKLKRLYLRGYHLCYDEEDHSMEIIAPYLQHLEISGDLCDLKCRLVDVSSVTTAKLTFNIECIKYIEGNRGLAFNGAEDSCRDYHQIFRTLVLDYLQKLSNATELTIGTWFTEVVCMLQFKGVALPELKCKYLKLDLHMSNFNLYGATGLLRASPHVEKLTIDLENTHIDESWCKFELGYLAKGDSIDLHSFAFPNLKKVKIVNSFDSCLKDHLEWAYVEKIFKLSEFLLKNVTFMEKFVIISKRRKCKECSMNCTFRYLCRLAEELVDCLRSSTSCEIIFLGGGKWAGWIGFGLVKYGSSKNGLDMDLFILIWVKCGLGKYGLVKN